MGIHGGGGILNAIKDILGFRKFIKFQVCETRQEISQSPVARGYAWGGKQKKSICFLSAVDFHNTECKRFKQYCLEKGAGFYLPFTLQVSKLTDLKDIDAFSQRDCIRNKINRTCLPCGGVICVGLFLSVAIENPSSFNQFWFNLFYLKL